MVIRKNLLCAAIMIVLAERFPNVVVATDGTILATWGKTSLRIRRSDDGGTMARFNLSWLLAGKKTGDGTLPKWLEQGG